jgi:hypothetical protein
MAMYCQDNTSTSVDVSWTCFKLGWNHRHLVLVDHLELRELETGTISGEPDVWVSPGPRSTASNGVSPDGGLLPELPQLFDLLVPITRRGISGAWLFRLQRTSK